MRMINRALFCALVLSIAQAARAESDSPAHSEPDTASGSREEKDDDALTKWKATVKERKNPEVIAGMDSDEFREREASSFEAYRRAVAGTLPMKDLIAARPEASAELRRRLDEVMERAITHEKMLEQVMQLAGAKDSPAAVKAHAEALLAGAPRIGWKPFLTMVRNAVEKKAPPVGAAGDMLEKILAAIPEAARKQMKTDVEAYTVVDAKEEDRKAGAARTKDAILAAAKEKGLVAKVLPGGDASFEMTKIALNDPKDKTGLTYVIDVSPTKGADGAIRMRTEIALTRKDIVKDTAKLPSGDWASKGLPENTPIQSDQMATATPGETKRLVEYERKVTPTISVSEYEWFNQHFPKHEDEIMAAFDVHRV